MTESKLPLTTKETDLKIIDELLVIMKGPSETWEDMEKKYSITRDAMKRLKQAWLDGELPLITLSLANYFNEDFQEMRQRIGIELPPFIHPVEGRGSVGQLAAVQEHLEDMRKIVFESFLNTVRHEPIKQHINLD